MGKNTCITIYAHILCIFYSMQISEEGFIRAVQMAAVTSQTSEPEETTTHTMAPPTRHCAGREKQRITVISPYVITEPEPKRPATDLMGPPIRYHRNKKNKQTRLKPILYNPHTSPQTMISEAEEDRQLQFDMDEMDMMIGQWAECVEEDKSIE